MTRVVLAALVAVLLVPAAAHATITKVEARDFDAVAGETFSGVVATFEDDQIDNPAIFDATITWGDGSQSEGAISCPGCSGQGPYTYEVRGEHAYNDAGDRTFTVRVDNDPQQESVADDAVAHVKAKQQQQPPPTQTQTQSQPPPPPPEPPKPDPPKPDPPKPPTASLSLVGPAPSAGGVLSLTAAGSTAAPGKTIVAHLWDLNGDGDYEANTGKKPTATYITDGAGSHSAKVKVIDSSGLTHEKEVGYQVSPAATGCESSLFVGKVRIRAACIKPAGSGGARAAQAGIGTELISKGKAFEVGGVIDFNGLQISGAGKLMVDFAAGTIKSTVGITVKLNNTPLGDIVIYRKSGDVTWRLPVNGSVLAGKEFHLVTLGAGSGCKEGERAYCAKLPGNFPMTGSVDVHLTSAAEIKLTVNAELSTPFTITGEVALRMVPKEGLKLDSLRFGMENAEFGVFTLQTLRFVYEAPGTGDPFHEGDLWEVEVLVKLPTLPKSEVGGTLRFVGGEFNYGRAILTIPGGIPVGPGMMLNHFEGEFGLKPTTIGGGLGVSLAGVAQVNGRFRYVSDKTYARLHVGGDFSLLGQQLATAYFDYWSTGYVAFGGAFVYNYPQHSTDPLIHVNGSVAVWFEGSRFQAEGHVYVAVWEISAHVGAIANNTYMGACASVDVGFGRIGGYGVLNLNSGALKVGFGCKMSSWRIHPLKGPPARAAQAGGTTLSVGRDEEALGIELTGRGGSPVVTLVGPKGERFTTPAVAGAIAGEKDRWVASHYAELDRTIIRIEKPSPGVWRIDPEPGSPAIERMETQGQLPDPAVKVRVEGRGGRRVLRYSMNAAPGRRVRLVERGTTSLQEVCVITAAAGTCPLRAEPGAPARRIEATVEQDGMPQEKLTVARYTAPSGRPAKPTRVRIVRRGSRAIATWRPVKGASGYRVVVSSNDGRRELMLPRSARVVVSGLVPVDTVNVRVQAMAGAAQVTGSAASARLGAVRRARRSG